jgi:hypothetical protein
MFASLRASTLSPDALDWYARYADCIGCADMKAFRDLLHERCTYQLNNFLPLYGPDVTAEAVMRVRGAVEGLRIEVISALGTDTAFGLEQLHHYLRKDRVSVTVPAAVFIDRDPASGLMLATRAHIDFTPVFGELRVEEV